jgi:hypothetical protein
MEIFEEISDDEDGHKEENTDHICIVAATHQQSLLQLCREEERQ